MTSNKQLCIADFFQEPILKIWLQIVVKAGAINFDALHQLLYLLFNEFAQCTLEKQSSTNHVITSDPLQWRHNERHGVSDHQPHDRLLNRLFRHRSKKTLKLRVTDLCAGNSPVTGEFLAQRARNAENVSIWQRHHVILGWTKHAIESGKTTSI